MPEVSVVVVPRDRFSMAVESFESVLATVDARHELVYVDGNTPRRVADALHRAAEGRDVRFVRRDHYLSPNEARNIGLAHTSGRYVAFIDNDVVAAPGWLDALVRCAEETGAAVVTPLTCQGYPPHQFVHHAGGTFTRYEDPSTFFTDGTPMGEREIHELQYHMGEPKAPLDGQLKRQKTGTCEFHCVMARRDMLDQVAPFDEELLASKEHLDFSMRVYQAGGQIFFEPDSIVTYVFPSSKRPLAPDDRPFFMLRWSTDWSRQSLARFRDTWGFRDSAYFGAKANVICWRRAQAVIIPMLARVPGLRKSRKWMNRGARVLLPLETMIGGMIVRRHRRERARRQPASDPASVPRTAAVP